MRSTGASGGAGRVRACGKAGRDARPSAGAAVPLLPEVTCPELSGRARAPGGRAEGAWRPPSSLLRGSASPGPRCGPARVGARGGGSGGGGGGCRSWAGRERRPWRVTAGCRWRPTRRGAPAREEERRPRGPGRREPGSRRARAAASESLLSPRSQVTHQFLKQLGLHPKWQFVDVYGMDPELLSMVPRPVCAVLLLFPITEKYEVFRTEEEEKIKSQGQDVTSSVYFMKQMISNACGTIGLIHAIANNKDKMHFGYTSNS